MPELDLDIILELSDETKSARLERIRAALEDMQEAPAETEVT